MDASGDAKTFVVTGVTSGIGLALARALAHTAERLVIVSRNEARLHAATEATRHEELNVEILPILADLGTLEGTRSLAEQLDRLPRIDALIHNAGILPAQRRLTPDGFEESFATNHLAPFVLNRRLRRRLIASAPSRVVQVSAGLALGASVDLEGDPRGARFEPVSTYARTKLWNLLATLEFAAELERSGVTVNAVQRRRSNAPRGRRARRSGRRGQARMALAGSGCPWAPSPRDCSGVGAHDRALLRSDPRDGDPPPGRRGQSRGA
jgi:NAD(P)-dependent dehydrogenase (short-subunit alcohol dehydrogenase family)